MRKALGVDLPDVVGRLTPLEGHEDSGLFNLALPALLLGGELADVFLLLPPFDHLPELSVLPVSGLLAERELVVLLQVFDPLDEGLFRGLHFLGKLLDLLAELGVLDHVIGDSLAVLFYLEGADVTVRAVGFLDEALVLQLLIVGIELGLDLFLGGRVGDALDHDAKIGGGDGVVVDHAFVLDFVVVDEKKDGHPDEDHCHQQPRLHQYHALQRGIRAHVQHYCCVG